MYLQNIACFAILQISRSKVREISPKTACQTTLPAWYLDTTDMGLSRPLSFRIGYDGNWCYGRKIRTNVKGAAKYTERRSFWYGSWTCCQTKSKVLWSKKWAYYLLMEKIFVYISYNLGVILLGGGGKNWILKINKTDVSSEH